MTPPQEARADKQSRFKQLNDYYGTPAARGKRVEFEGRPAVITSSTGSHLRLRFEGNDRSSGPFHPLWRIDYLDGINYAAGHDSRINAFMEALR